MPDVGTSMCWGHSQQNNQKTMESCLPLPPPELLIHQESGITRGFCPRTSEFSHSLPPTLLHTRAHFRQTGEPVPNCRQVRPANKGLSAQSHKLKLPTLQTQGKGGFLADWLKEMLQARSHLRMSHLYHLWPQSLSTPSPQFISPFSSLLYSLLFTLEWQLLQGRGLCLFTNEPQNSTWHDRSSRNPFPPLSFIEM